MYKLYFLYKNSCQNQMISIQLVLIKKYKDSKNLQEKRFSNSKTLINAFLQESLGIIFQR